MRYHILLILSFWSLFLTGCKQHRKQTKIPVFDFILPKAGYIIKINKQDAIIKQNPVITDYYLRFSDKSFLSKAGFNTPYLINILQNNSKIKGFVASGTLRHIDSLFNGETTVYQQDTIYKTTYKKTNYYATVINGTSFISNQKLFIENCIREQNEFGQLAQNKQFKKGIGSLDNNADMNLIIRTDQLKPDIFFNGSFKIKMQDTGNWQFLDLVDSQKQIASGIGLCRDSLCVINGIFQSVNSVPQDFSHYTPFAVNESIILNFNDFEQFINNLNNFKLYAPQQSVEGRELLTSLSGLSFFKENGNLAVLLKLTDLQDWQDDTMEKSTDFNNFEIYKFPYNDLINSYFSNIIPGISARFFTIVDNTVIITSSESYLEKILNDIQNHATLSQSKTYQNLIAELPDNYHLVLFKNKLDIKGQKYMEAQTYKVDDNAVFTNLVLKAFVSSRKQTIVEQVLTYILSGRPKSDPQLVYNHHTKTYNIIYQDDKERLNFVDLKGKTLWQTDLKGDIKGKIYQVDLFRNHKIQYTFVTPHHWYVIDRLGRNVENFPDYFLKKITKGISVFDYEHNRKYRFGITQSNSFKLFDNQAKKVKGFKVKIKNDIIFAPKHFRIGNKDFIQISDNKGKLYLLNRRGETRIKVSQTFDVSRNQWGVKNRKFINIDDNDKLLSIDLNGKLKTGILDLPGHILSEIKHETLTAVAGNKLLINKKIIELDLGTYSRPHIYKSGKQIIIFIANTTNNRIYAFDKNGNVLPNFPITGQQVLDFKTIKNIRYLLAYDSAHNLIVYKF